MADTGSGKKYEDVVEFVVRGQGLAARKQVTVGTKPGGGKHRIDVLVWDPEDRERRALVSCKVQNAAGTAEEKLAYEVIKLLHALKTDPRNVAAYLVLGGTGFSADARTFIREKLTDFVPDAAQVRILTTDEMISGGITVPAAEPVTC